MKEIEINNFRCFSRLSVELTQGVNLFVGDNASGKTSLLMAVKYALNCFFAGFSSRYTVWQTPGREDFRQIFSGEKKFEEDPIILNFSFWPGDLGASNSGDEVLTLMKNNGKNTRAQLTGLHRLRQYGQWLGANYMKKTTAGGLEQREALPLIASYSTQDIHSNQKLERRLFTEYEQSPTFGYCHCCSTDGLLGLWCARWLTLKEADRNPVELEAVERAVIKVFGPEGCGVIRGIDARVNRREVVCLFADGRETPMTRLSDGYRRLMSIAVDMAFRCALLNSLKFGRDAAAETRGTVVIDEIDLHLHPRIQAEVLTAFQQAFPKVQFIVSTHAPMVMAGVRSCPLNRVNYMAFNRETGRYEVTEVEPFGMDVSTVSEVVLNVPSRVPEVSRRLDEVSELIDSEDFQAARVKLSELRAEFGERIPELSRMETEITLGEEFQ